MPRSLASSKRSSRDFDLSAQRSPEEMRELLQSQAPHVADGPVARARTGLISRMLFKHEYLRGYGLLAPALIVTGLTVLVPCAMLVTLSFWTSFPKRSNSRRRTWRTSGWPVFSTPLSRGACSSRWAMPRWRNRRRRGSSCHLGSVVESANCRGSIRVRHRVRPWLAARPTVPVPARSAPAFETVGLSRLEPAFAVESLRPNRSDRLNAAAIVCGVAAVRSFLI